MDYQIKKKLKRAALFENLTPEQQDRLSQDKIDDIKSELGDYEELINNFRDLKHTVTVQESLNTVDFINSSDTYNYSDDEINNTFQKMVEKMMKSNDLKFETKKMSKCESLCKAAHGVLDRTKNIVRHVITGQNAMTLLVGISVLGSFYFNIQSYNTAGTHLNDFKEHCYSNRDICASDSSSSACAIYAECSPNLIDYSGKQKTHDEFYSMLTTPLSTGLGIVGSALATYFIPDKNVSRMAAKEQRIKKALNDAINGIFVEFENSKTMQHQSSTQRPTDRVHYLILKNRFKDIIKKNINESKNEEFTIIESFFDLMDKQHEDWAKSWSKELFNDNFNELSKIYNDADGDITRVTKPYRIIDVPQRGNGGNGGLAQRPTHGPTQRQTHGQFFGTPGYTLHPNKGTRESNIGRNDSSSQFSINNQLSDTNDTRDDSYTDAMDTTSLDDDDKSNGSVNKPSRKRRRAEDDRDLFLNNVAKRQKQANDRTQQFDKFNTLHDNDKVEFIRSENKNNETAVLAIRSMLNSKKDNGNITPLEKILLKMSLERNTNDPATITKNTEDFENLTKPLNEEQKRTAIRKFKRMKQVQKVVFLRAQPKNHKKINAVVEYLQEMLDNCQDSKSDECKKYKIFIDITKENKSKNSAILNDSKLKEIDTHRLEIQNQKRQRKRDTKEQTRKQHENDFPYAQKVAGIISRYDTVDKVRITDWLGDCNGLLVTMSPDEKAKCNHRLEMFYNLYTFKLLVYFDKQQFSQKVEIESSDTKNRRDSYLSLGQDGILIVNQFFQNEWSTITIQIDKFRWINRNKSFGSAFKRFFRTEQDTYRNGQYPAVHFPQLVRSDTNQSSQQTENTHKRQKR